MGLFSWGSKKPSKLSNTPAKVSNTPPKPKSYWDTWKPGNKDLEQLVSSPGWIAASKPMLPNKGIEFAGLDLDRLGKFLGLNLGKGLGEYQVAKSVATEFQIEPERADSIVRQINALGMSLISLASYKGMVNKVEWLALCCEICDKNHEVQRRIGSKFPSGHITPPGCENCTCTLAPVVDF